MSSTASKNYCLYSTAFMLGTWYDLSRQSVLPLLLLLLTLGLPHDEDTARQTDKQTDRGAVVMSTVVSQLLREDGRRKNKIVHSRHLKKFISFPAREFVERCQKCHSIFTERFSPETNRQTALRVSTSGSDCSKT